MTASAPAPAAYQEDWHKLLKPAGCQEENVVCGWCRKAKKCWVHVETWHICSLECLRQAVEFAIADHL